MLNIKIQTMKNDLTQAKEELFREMAKNEAVCQSLDCPMKEHCLRSILTNYVPENYPVVTAVNLRNPMTQKANCPKYCSVEPVRMPLGLKRMYHDMPGHLERAIKNHLINLTNRKLYYEYHNGSRPITPDVEQLIRQTLHDFGWQQQPVFDDYTEEYLL